MSKLNLVLTVVLCALIANSALAQVDFESGTVTGTYTLDGNRLSLNVELASATPTITGTPTGTASSTPTVIVASATPTVIVASSTPTPTSTATSAPTSTPTPTAAPTSTPTQSPTPTRTPTSSPTPLPSAGKAFGAFDYVFDDSWPMFTSSRLTGSTTYLERARQRGAHVLVALTGGKPSYTDPSGCFSLSMWQARLNTANAAVLAPYIQDGTIAGLYAVDEPHDWTAGNPPRYCGPSSADLEAACAYAHARLPGIACGFNTPPSWLLSLQPHYQNIDFLFTQTNFQRVSGYAAWAAWAQQQRADAQRLGIGPLWLSMNIATSSPSPEAIRQAGLALCDSDAVGVMMWKASYLTEAMKPAMIEIAARCSR